MAFFPLIVSLCALVTTVSGVVQSHIERSAAASQRVLFLEQDGLRPAVEEEMLEFRQHVAADMRTDSPAVTDLEQLRDMSASPELASRITQEVRIDTGHNCSTSRRDSNMDRDTVIDRGKRCVRKVKRRTLNAFDALDDI